MQESAELYSDRKRKDERNMKTNKKTFESYLVGRLEKLDDEIEQLKRGEKWKEKTIESQCEQIKRLQDDLTFIFERFSTREFEGANILDFDAVWDTHDRDDYNRLKHLHDMYTGEPLPF